MDRPIGVLFVCLGNICRSPMAEGVFVDMARRRGVPDRFRVDSCGTGDWHAGELPDPRARAAARRRGIELTHRARVLEPDTDFVPPPEGDGFDWLIAMDQQNARRLRSLGAPPARVRLLRSFDPALSGLTDEHLQVPDPYTEHDEMFDDVLTMVERGCAGLMDILLR